MATPTPSDAQVKSVEVPDELPFVDVERPAVKQGRPPKPNPFRPAVEALSHSTDAEGRSVGAKAVPVPAEEFDTWARLARKAGAEFDVTVRTARVEEDAPEGHVFLVISTQPKITRTRRADDADDE